MGEERDICEFCKVKVEDVNHLLECDMVLSHLLTGSLSLSFPEETIVNFVSTIKKPNKLPILKWKSIRELCKDLREMLVLTNNMMYT